MKDHNDNITVFMLSFLLVMSFIDNAIIVMYFIQGGGQKTPIAPGTFFVSESSNKT